MGKEKRVNQLTQNEKMLVFLASWQIMECSENRVREYVKLYESRKAFYDKNSVSIKPRDMKEYGIVDKYSMESIQKVLLAFEDEMTREWVKEELLKDICPTFKKLIDEYSVSACPENVGERYASDIQYKIWYLERCINADKSIDITKEIEKRVNVRFSPSGAAKTKMLYDIMAKHSYDVLNMNGKRVKNDTIVSSHKGGEIARHTMKFIIESHINLDEKEVLEHYLIPIENQCLGGYGLDECEIRWAERGNEDEEGQEVRNTKHDDFIANSQYSHFAREYEASSDVIRSMVKDFQNTERLIFERGNELESLLMKESIAEVSYQIIARNINYHFLTHRIRKMKFSEQMKNRMISTGFMKLEHLGLGTSDEELLENEFARCVFLSTVLSEFYDTVISSFYDDLISKIAKESKKEVREKKKQEREESEFQSSFDKTLEEKNREIEKLKKKLEGYSELEKDNKDLKKRLRNLEHRIKKEREEVLESKLEKKEESEDNKEEEKKEESEDNKEEEKKEESRVEAREMTDSEFREMIRDKKILVWGVRESDARLLQPYREIKCFVTKKGSKNVERNQLDAYDGVVICTNHSNHSMYWKIRDMVRNAEVPYVHMRKTDTHISKYKNAIVTLCESMEENTSENA